MYHLFCSLIIYRKDYVMKFTTRSFLIDEDLALALVDKRLSRSMEDELRKKNIEIIKTVKCDRVYESISYHPDISLCNLGNGNIVVEPSLYKHYIELLEKYDFNIIKGETILQKKISI